MSSQVLEQRRPAGAKIDRRSILIVEDDPEVAEILALRLDKQGYRATKAETGELGLTLAREQQPDLVLLDLSLPDIDGFSVCQTLDEDPQTCHIPVIILSGMERPDVVRRARAAGCAYYVRKPYDPNALLVVIRHAIHEANRY